MTTTCHNVDCPEGHNIKNKCTKPGVANAKYCSWWRAEFE